jgi:hypothetical protein
MTGVGNDYLPTTIGLSEEITGKTLTVSFEDEQAPS